MSEYEQLKRILASAEEHEDSVYWDGKDILDCYGYLSYHPFTKSEKMPWRNLQDIKQIVDLIEDNDRILTAYVGLHAESVERLNTAVSANTRKTVEGLSDE